MDLKTAVQIALETNPEIGEASANRRAIDFEYQQAKQLGNPNLIFEGRAGPELIDSRTTRLFGTDDEFLFARQASVTLQQNLYSFGRHDAEQDRQASRSDAAANRVWERTEFVSLDVTQAYYDIMRLREILDHSDENVRFHQEMLDDLTRGVTSGITRETDRVQAQERLSSSMISRSEVEESHDLAMAKFLQLVGQDIGNVVTPPALGGPKSLAGALEAARRNNPTIKIAYADLDVARAEYRAAKAERLPELGLEVDGRAGDHVGGFRDRSNDLRAQVVFRYEFRGGIRSSAVQEHINWVDEARQRVMTIERNVENLVRNAWITREKTRDRVKDLQSRVTTGEKLRSDYQREFRLGNRSLLDILNSQEDLFQSQTALITAQQADNYAHYRLLAATGQLLSALGLEPRREAKANLRDIESVPLTPPADSEKRKNPRHFDEVMEMQGWTSQSDRRIASTDLVVKPVEMAKAEPVETIEADVQEYAEISTPEMTPQPSISVTPSISVDESQFAPVVAETAAINTDAAMIEATSTVAEPQSGYVQFVDVQPVAIPTEVQSVSVVSASVQPDYVDYIEASPSAIEYSQEPLNPVISSVEDVVEKTAAIESSDSDELPIGVAIKHVELEEFLQLSNQDGARHYPSMNALLLDNELFLLSGT